MTHQVGLFVKAVSRSRSYDYSQSFTMLVQVAFHIQLQLGDDSSITGQKKGEMFRKKVMAMVIANAKTG